MPLLLLPALLLPVRLLALERQRQAPGRLPVWRRLSWRLVLLLQVLRLLVWQQQVSLQLAWRQLLRQAWQLVSLQPQPAFLLLA
ncbi:hypothetical protein [Duganella sp. Leaf61]|uniref:hypothetical protein n=1 Tax=Duganella sp. Leaf61 TaxID=1736227 RepID=UPI00191092EB|nr:hypothetical protein [Duganella sp. Leaf61]